MLICVYGKLKIKCSHKNNEAVYGLNKSDEALYIAPYVWRTSFEHSMDTVLLEWASLEYNQEDYIRDYEKI